VKRSLPVALYCWEGPWIFRGRSPSRNLTIRVIEKKSPLSREECKTGEARRIIKHTRLWERGRICLKRRGKASRYGGIFRNKKREDVAATRRGVAEKMVYTTKQGGITCVVGGNNSKLGK